MTAMHPPTRQGSDAASSLDKAAIDATSTDSPRIPAVELAPAEVGEIDLYQKREKIYTRKIEGFFQRLRLFTGWPLLIGYFLLPWLRWDGHQAVLFDLPARKFHILGLTFWPQDMTLLAWVLIVAAFGLFTITNFAGRVWCGYTCPQTVWTSIFMWLEQKSEGTRNQRIKLDARPWNLEKLRKKGLKHALWMGFALLTGFTFIGYFTDIRGLLMDFTQWQVNPWALSWTVFFTLATYINAGWMREQVCLYMCPYARFQSVMFDPDTLVISYDQDRGEPRGSRKRGTKGSPNQGDCIDCRLCVQVCPTGIDIRNGLQYQCIGCALCVDACNSVMEKMGYAKGLIRYASENSLQHKPSRILRPRLIGYTTVLVVMAALLILQLASRTLIEFSVIRDRQALYSVAADDHIENHYTIKVANKGSTLQHFQLHMDTDAPLEIHGNSRISVPGGELMELPLRIRMKPGSHPAERTEVRLTLVGEQSEAESATVSTSFYTPPANQADRRAGSTSQ
ncbi:cytochrome c oxidase accessory protein CcoG [Spongiibacter taiwanensis]|uniref:cytochrome c oxidase accessory protein CcoG n=1 Tax=Spongiibacter taiwanensis TaxID=1748242 RepID=UPI0020354FAB|nr:cytochrome c oxidase accessory protein CcoG [Spongiibacter taiwanensis]USA43030.1 cytochrome c oxidase accessory protein CcoG [Spongiibacter taiwanensis]